MTKNSSSSRDVVSRLQIAEALLPGIGYFGGTPETALSVPIDEEVDRIEIAVEAPRPEILNIGKIDLYSVDGRHVDRAAVCQRVRLSSEHKGKSEDIVLDDFLSGRLLHSRAELRPTLQIDLSKPIRLQKLSIANRRDIHGSRSRFLAVRAFRSATLVANYTNMSEETVDYELRELMCLLDMTLPELIIRADLPVFEREVKRRIVDKIEGNTFGLDEQKLKQLLPMHDASPELDTFHITVLAHAVLSEWRDGQYAATSFLKPFGAFLSTDLSLLRLQQEVERLRNLRQGESGSVTISRHAIHNGRLIANADQYISAMDRAIIILKRANVTAMLGYGTLLGAVREKGFLAHDDDVDLITFDGATNQLEAEAGKQRITASLQSAGFRVTESGHGHLHASIEGASLDLFPSWMSDGLLHLAMEQLRVRGVPAESILPPSQIEFYGRSFPAPADPQAFLSDRYGSDWNIPNPYYGWPWRVHRILSGFSKPIAAAREQREGSSRRDLGRLCRVAWGQLVRAENGSPPKNSLPVIKVAHQTGYDAVELDVRFSSDEVPVLAHDDNLVGIDGEVRVTNTRADELLRFRLGHFEGATVCIPTLEEALTSAADLGVDVQIDWRNAMDHDRRAIRLRKSVDESGIDPARLQFCVPDLARAQVLIKAFPESVLMRKTYRGFDEVDEFFLDEAVELGMDGVMVTLSRRRADYVPFMEKVRERGLRALLFLHSGGDDSLQRMIEAGVNYVTTTANDSRVFKAIGVVERA